VRNDKKQVAVADNYLLQEGEEFLWKAGVKVEKKPEPDKQPKPKQDPTPTPADNVDPGTSQWIQDLKKWTGLDASGVGAFLKSLFVQLGKVALTSASLTAIANAVYVFLKGVMTNWRLLMKGDMTKFLKSNLLFVGVALGVTAGVMLINKAMAYMYNEKREENSMNVAERMHGVITHAYHLMFLPYGDKTPEMERRMGVASPERMEQYHKDNYWVMTIVTSALFIGLLKANPKLLIKVAKFGKKLLYVSAKTGQSDTALMGAKMMSASRRGGTWF
jgi:hypothetical protein